MPKVSVVTPIYNTENDIKRCLDSICSQTLSDIEIICVNDGSVDNSFEILNEYSSFDKRIKIINFKKNKGAAFSRNTAIKEAKGEYIGFVDSDDFIDLDFFEKLYFSAIKSNAVCAKGDIVDIDLNNNKIPLKLNSKIKINKYYFNSCFTSAIYKKEFIVKNNISFLDDCIWGEDRLFPLKVAYYADFIELVDNANYYYKRRTNSITFSEFNSEKMDSVLKSANYIVDFISNYTFNSNDYNLIYNEFLKDIVFLMLKNNIFDEKNICALKFILKKYKLSDMNYFVKTIFDYIYSEDFLSLKDNFSKIVQKSSQIELIKNIKNKEVCCG